MDETKLNKFTVVSSDGTMKEAEAPTNSPFKTYRITYLDDTTEDIKRTGFEIFPGVNAFFLTKDTKEESELTDFYNMNTIKKVEVIV